MRSCPLRITSPIRSLNETQLLPCRTRSPTIGRQAHHERNCSRCSGRDHRSHIGDRQGGCAGVGPPGSTAHDRVPQRGQGRRDRRRAARHDARVVGRRRPLRPRGPGLRAPRRIRAGRPLRRHRCAHQQRRRQRHAVVAHRGGLRPHDGLELPRPVPADPTRPRACQGSCAGAASWWSARRRTGWPARSTRNASRSSAATAR